MMMIRKVTILSDGLGLAGLLTLPADDERPRPAVIVLHGFGGSKDAPGHRLEAEMYAALGYVVLQIDFRGCAASEGARGRILCNDAVIDAQSALTWLARQPMVDPRRIALSGQSYGAAIAIQTAGIDPRVAAAVSFGGWGNGLTKFKAQHSGEAAWDRFEAMLADGRSKQAEGIVAMASRWDIVPIPKHLRANLPEGSIMEFPVEVAQSMVDFRPVDVVARIAPRPLLLIHAAKDSVTPSEQSIELIRHAGSGAELMLLARLDHFPFASGESRLRNLVDGWLRAYFPLAEL